MPKMKSLPFLLVCLTVASAKAEVNVSGLQSAEHENVLLTMALAKEPCSSPEWKIRHLFANADADIDEALRALGFYHAEISKTLNFKEACWQADFNVKAGPPTLIESVSIALSGEAKDDADFQKLLAKLSAAKGMVLHHDFYEKMKHRIDALAQEKGYLKSQFTEHQLLIDKANNSAAIKLSFESGKRLFFGAITIQQDSLNPDFVKQYLPIKTGDYYTGAGLAKTYTVFSNSDYFKTIAIRPDTEGIQANQIPVNITLTPKPKYHYSGGLGFDTDIGPLLSGSFINRRLNRRGHYLTANIDISPVLSTADAEYNIPLSHPVTDSFSLGGGLKREDNQSYRSLSAKLAGRLKHAYSDGWKQTLALDLSYEDFVTGATSGQTFLLVPSASWLRTKTDDLLRPSNGYRVQFDVSGSHQSLLSSVSFAQALFSGTLIHPAFGDAKWIAHTDLGATLADPFARLPTTYRFYAGGLNSVRGYAYRELGPKDSAGAVEGGRYLTTLSAEYEQPILKDWALAAFIDSGNAYNSSKINLKTGVGLGIRWFSPIGPVRLDVGIPLNESKSSFQIHFSAGSRL
ncbi:MAG: autotransporter assembly complex family protein [Methylococcaceae bacterium]|jgi:translocation and assembly module TamA